VALGSSGKNVVRSWNRQQTTYISDPFEFIYRRIKISAERVNIRDEYVYFSIFKLNIIKFKLKANGRKYEKPLVT
jgi:hypothetical protein